MNNKEINWNQRDSESREFGGTHYATAVQVLDNQEAEINWSRRDPENRKLGGVHYGMIEQVLDTQDGEALHLLQFPELKKLDGISHCFSTRLGGVSTGLLSNLNFGNRLGETEEHLMENYRRVSRALGTAPDHIVTTKQTHTTNVRRASALDAGKGVIRPLDYMDVDGLITNEPGLCLNAFGSDCPVLYFYDPEHEAIGLSHAGWRGTVGRIGQVTIRAMSQEFETRPEDLFCAIGPSICQDCYEVSQDVADVFRAEFPSFSDKILSPGRTEVSPSSGEKIYHWQLDLWTCNALVLTECGVAEDHISITDICTNCNPDSLFSHRATKGMRGNNGAFLMLKG